MNDHLQRAVKIAERINELASCSEDESRLTRTFGSKAFEKAAKKVSEWMKDAGLKTTIDNIGNVRGRLLSAAPGAKTFVIASHIDTVVNAGKFDGPLGILTGLDLVENIIKNKLQLPFNIELIAFSDEEGARFHTTYLGSKVVAGSFDAELLDRKDTSGTTLKEAIHKIDGTVHKLDKDAIAPKDWLGYFEIHIEQGPVLYEKNIPVAVVVAIAAQQRVEITFRGVAAHAGTIPMDMRNDALCAAAEFILIVERFALEYKHNMVATIGKLDISHAASNVIPGEVVCTLDARSADETALAIACDSIKDQCHEICNRRNILFEWNVVQETKPVACDQKMNTLLSQCIAEAGYEVIKLVSGAGHDAVPISHVSPVAMLFVRCFKGISHNPLEDVETKDIAAAIRIADCFIEQLIKHN